MTHRLYYADAALLSFDATVVSVEAGDGPGRWRVRLDRTAFYPTSGGQPFDTGTIDGARVVDVVDAVDVTDVTNMVGAADGNAIIHVVDGPFDPTPGRAVAGTIDGVRRRDHMQQHTGQHLLSAAFDRLFGARTVSFHLGTGTSTIDLSRELTAREIAAAEDEANRVVWEDRPVAVRFVSAEEAAALPLRKESARAGTLRLVEIADFDLSACGGTHVPSTGGIGTIAIASWERFKGGQRVEFLSGARTLARFRAMRDTASENGRLLSVAAADVPASIERLQGELKAERRTLAVRQVELTRYRAEELARSAEETPRGRVVLAAEEGGDAAALKMLASAVAAHPRVVVVLTAPGTLVIVARSGDADPSVRANDVLAGLLTRFGGRGGGKAEMAQAGGLTGTAAEVLAEARRLLTA